MDFKGVNSVFDYDFPDSASAYVHRIAINFYTEEDIPFLRKRDSILAHGVAEKEVEETPAQKRFNLNKNP
ncbi:hypothetical protein ACSQ67_001535 [Phaseolus vulgaris]